MSKIDKAKLGEEKIKAPINCTRRKWKRLSDAETLRRDVELPRLILLEP